MPLDKIRYHYSFKSLSGFISPSFGTQFNLEAFYAPNVISVYEKLNLPVQLPA